MIEKIMLFLTLIGYSNDYIKDTSTISVNIKEAHMCRVNHYLKDPKSSNFVREILNKYVNSIKNNPHDESWLFIFKI